MSYLISRMEGDDVPYLFRSITTVIEFVVIEAEMDSVNEFCVSCQTATARSLRQASEQLEEVQVRPPQDPVVEMVLEDELQSWRHNERVIQIGMVLVVLFAFVEKQLQWLCNRLGDNPAGKIRARPSESKIDAYLRYIRDVHGLEFDTPERSVPAFQMLKRVRNDFAHGDWESIESRLEEIDPSRAFMAATALFDAIELAYQEQRCS